MPSVDPGVRYKGRPFVRLLECYVLLQIGELDQKTQSTLLAAGPRLQEVYGQTGPWDRIVARQLNLPPGFPDALRQEWARAQRAGLSAQIFAEIATDRIIE